MTDSSDVFRPGSGSVAVIESAHGGSTRGASTIVQQRPLSPELRAQVKLFASASLAESTKRVYRAGWKQFVIWCAPRGRLSMPAAPETVAAFLADCASTKGLSAIETRFAAIQLAHKIKRQPDPTKDELVVQILAGIRRKIGTRPERRVAALTLDLIASGLARLNRTTAKGKRDAAILLVGHAGAYRRSELRGLDLSDIRREPDGVSILLRRSKTDQGGAGAWKAITLGHGATCPVQALDAWLAVRGAAPGALFCGINRTGRVKGSTVAALVKRTARSIGCASRVSGHSLRAGFVTDAHRRGASTLEIGLQTFHRDLNQLAAYVREVDPSRGNAVRRIHHGAGSATDAAAAAPDVAAPDEKKT